MKAFSIFAFAVVYLLLIAALCVAGIQGDRYRKEALTLRHLLAVDEVKLANQEEPAPPYSPQPTYYSFGSAGFIQMTTGGVFTAAKPSLDCARDSHHPTSVNISYTSDSMHVECGAIERDPQ